MIKTLKILCAPTGEPVGAMFDTTMQSDGPDNGTRVKHLVYRDSECGGYWHERIWLSRCVRYIKPSYTKYVSKRKFWKKVRLVQTREICLAETWFAVASAIRVIEEKSKRL